MATASAGLLALARRFDLGAVGIGRVRLGNLHAHRAVAFGREISALESGKCFGNEWLQHVGRERFDLVTAAHRRADDLADRFALRLSLGYVAPEAEVLVPQSSASPLASISTVA